MGGALGNLKQSIESHVDEIVVKPQPPPVENSKETSTPPNQAEKEQSEPMSTPPKQAEKEQSKPEATDLPTNQPGPESPEATDLLTDQPGSEATKGEEEEEEEGECGFCLFMKAGGCKEPFVDWENCVKEAEDKNEDLVEKCSQVTARLKQCMDAHSDYYEPILRAEKHAEEQAIVELEKEKQDSEASNNTQEQATIELEKEKQDSAPNNNQQEEKTA